MGGLSSGRRVQECLRLGEAAAGLRGVGGGWLSAQARSPALVSLPLSLH